MPKERTQYRVTGAMFQNSFVLKVYSGEFYSASVTSIPFPPLVKSLTREDEATLKAAKSLKRPIPTLSLLQTISKTHRSTGKQGVRNDPALVTLVCSLPHSSPS